MKFGFREAGEHSPGQEMKKNKFRAPLLKCGQNIFCLDRNLVLVKKVHFSKLSWKLSI